MKKRFLSALMAIIIVAIGIIPAQAATYSTASDTADAAELVSLYAATAPNATARARGGFTIGEPLPVYELKGSQLIPYQQVRYYPVYSGTSVYGIYTVVDVDSGSPTYSFSKEFADILNEFIADGDNQFSVVYDTPATYIKSERQSQVFLKTIGYRLDGQNEAFNDRTALINSIPLMNSPISGMSRKPLANIPQAYASRHTIPLDTWDQSASSSTSKLCWAGTMWAIGSYKKPEIVKTPKGIAIEVGLENKGAYPSDIPGYYDSVYAITANYQKDSGVLAPDVIADYIDSDNPIHGSWQGDYYGHSMAILGYQDDGMQICVMDTNIGDWKWMKNPDQDYKYSHSGETGVWTNSITF